MWNNCPDIDATIASQLSTFGGQRERGEKSKMESGIGRVEDVLSPLLRFQRTDVRDKGEDGIGKRRMCVKRRVQTQVSVDKYACNGEKGGDGSKCQIMWTIIWGVRVGVCVVCCNILKAINERVWQTLKPGMKGGQKI